jgi:hypothetical protein
VRELRASAVLKWYSGVITDGKYCLVYTPHKQRGITRIGVASYLYTCHAHKIYVYNFRMDLYMSLIIENFKCEETKGLKFS